jgi:hypothetical protein
MSVKKHDLSFLGARRKKSLFRAALVLGNSGLSGTGFCEGLAALENDVAGEAAVGAVAGCAGSGFAEGAGCAGSGFAGGAA